MKESPAHFELVKKQNKKVIRNLLHIESSLSVSQLAERAELSYPTVSQLLKELHKSGEVQVISEKESCGGRPGIRYELNYEYQYAAIMYFKDWYLKCSIYNAGGIRVEQKEMLIDENITVDRLVSFIESIKGQYKALSAIGFGIPGVALDGEIKFLPKFKNLEGKYLYQVITEKFAINIIIENDINAIAMAETDKWESFAHVIEIDGCIGAGIVLKGELLRGTRGYAGEMEYLCNNMSDRILSFAQAIQAIICVLDFNEIIITADGFGESEIVCIQEKLKNMLPKDRMPELHIVDNAFDMYEKGLLKFVMQKWKTETKD